MAAFPSSAGFDASILIQPLIRVMGLGNAVVQVATAVSYHSPALTEVVEWALLGLDGA